jgi:hypothetical protein
VPGPPAHQLKKGPPGGPPTGGRGAPLGPKQSHTTRKFPKLTKTQFFSQFLTWKHAISQKLSPPAGPRTLERAPGPLPIWLVRFAHSRATPGVAKGPPPYDMISKTVCNINKSTTSKNSSLAEKTRSELYHLLPLYKIRNRFVPKKFPIKTILERTDSSIKNLGKVESIISERVSIGNFFVIDRFQFLCSDAFL